MCTSTKNKTQHILAWHFFVSRSTTTLTCSIIIIINIIIIIIYSIYIAPDPLQLFSKGLYLIHNAKLILLKTGTLFEWLGVKTEH